MKVEAWSRRPFARTFDLISRDYGWTDSTILGLTIGRFVQIRSVLFERAAEERRERLQDKENEVKALAQFMARGEKAQRAVASIRFVTPPPEAGVQYTPSGKRVGPIPAERVSSLFGSAR